ncbi:hypothetical protein AVEN_102913-1 [Araneus ventricosus]|uniref:Tc1-like transposase DDE domain-containing protein n=1 Tax=Araneus ventricosus TaxID=182803 RepID=A0A4Y2I0A8_ARAVE|nr:hypothetical protein AVEN_102913-1 [Araneus ventricosus]
MKDKCSHDDLLFVCLCPQHPSERGSIGPVNIAVGHQNSETTYSLRMSLDLTSRTIPEGQFAAGSVTVVRYRDEILHPLVRTFIVAMGTDVIFMDDNARPHRARLVRGFLESETIPQTTWPARSPDLNPIEHVWEMLRRRIAGRSVPPGSLHELQQALLQE